MKQEKIGFTAFAIVMIFLIGIVAGLFMGENYGYKKGYEEGKIDGYNIARGKNLIEFCEQVDELCYDELLGFCYLMAPEYDFWKDDYPPRICFMSMD